MVLIVEVLGGILLVEVVETIVVSHHQVESLCNSS